MHRSNAQHNETSNAQHDETIAPVLHDYTSSEKSMAAVHLIVYNTFLLKEIKFAKFKLPKAR